MTIASRSSTVYITNTIAKCKFINILVINMLIVLSKWINREDNFVGGVYAGGCEGVQEHPPKKANLKKNRQKSRGNLAFHQGFGFI